MSNIDSDYVGVHSKITIGVSLKKGDEYVNMIRRLYDDMFIKKMQRP